MPDLNLHNLDKIAELGEGQFIEFKESFDKCLQKEIVAFANASGGAIYLGITDNGILKGLDITNRLKSQIQDIAYNCDPSIIINLIEKDHILVVEVPEGKNKPYSCSSGFFMRMGANSQKMTRNEILSLAIKSGKVRFDEQICSNFDWKDFDDEKFTYYLKLAGILYNLPKEEILRNLRVLADDGMTNAGVLYFAKQPYKYVISSKIRCIHFNDDERIDILDKKEVDRGIIGNIEFAEAYLKERVPVRFEIKELRRKEFPEYPLEAYREAIVNSIVHFDYFLGDTIAIEKHKNSIVINNKGELLFPEKEFGKKSEARNRLLVDLLARTDFMEKAGTGIKRITNACVDNGNKVHFEFSDSFWLTIQSNKSQVVEKVVEKVAEKVAGNLSENQNQIIELVVRDNYITAYEIAKEIGISHRKVQESGTGIKRITNACVDNGNKVHFEFSDSFWLTIQSNKSQVVEKVVEKVAEKVAGNLSENQNQIIELVVRDNYITAYEIAKEIGISHRKVIWLN
jgi:ATP-dependent DNA helicase RecG